MLKSWGIERMGQLAYKCKIGNACEIQRILKF